MLIVGAGGLVLQMIDDLLSCGHNIVLWADMPVDRDILKNNFKIINTEEAVINELLIDNRFVICIGIPAKRKQLAEKFQKLGGILTSFTSPKANVSNFAEISEGCVILHGTVIEAGVSMGKGCLINTGALLTHECTIGNFVEIGPGAVLAGNAKVKDGAFIATNTSILPKIVIGENAIVGASALVNRNVDDNTVVAGVPAKRIPK
ncbi:MAG TPA: NeuD/PglB/VioB family sugar acetyltransferase [Chitinophagaceae bacterium]|nr:NeuD/PglB/VioB family sugar acetyltransferase [Chitinophagaceae bacterium]